MSPFSNSAPFGHSLTRREALKSLTAGFSSIALASILNGTARAEENNPFAPKPPHFTPKAKRVIFFFMNGGPSQMDTFDPKPLLNKYHGQPPSGELFAERTMGQLLGSPFKFQRHGQSGLEISEIYPNIAKYADDLCVIRSMQTDTVDHLPAMILMNNGHFREVRPSMGAWISFGLGTENQNLPAFFAFCPIGYPNKGPENWQAAFLPGVFQGTFIDVSRSTEAIPNLSGSKLPRDMQRRQLDLVQQLNRKHSTLRQSPDPLETRILSYELAFRMQTEASEAFDLSKESQSTRERYGDTNYGRQTLLARRLLERGVRFIQVYQGLDKPWDSHDQNAPRHEMLAKESDQPIAALLQDLKDRDMLKDTLVIWGGEFGRTPTSEMKFSGPDAIYSAGRDHNRHGFTMWMAGGGVKGGTVFGKTDDFGMSAIENPVHIHDLHATILHLLGLDHHRLTYEHSGREFRLTDEFGNVMRDIIA
ncbi:DUF1501 domain-containing protein [bacterium]|nr:DUF1501 domain-containing protein [bacterium]